MNNYSKKKKRNFLTLSFVPTPSVPETRIGFLNPIDTKSNKAPKPPRDEITPDRKVCLQAGLMALTKSSPAFMSTPLAL